MKAVRGSGVKTPLILNSDIKWRYLLSLMPPLPYSRRTAPSIHEVGDWVVGSAGLVMLEKCLFGLTGFEAWYIHTVS
jgi:hypothetical protein